MSETWLTRHQWCTRQSWRSPQGMSFWPSGRMTQPARVIVIHSTETVGFPGYANGASAPHFTIDLVSGHVRQHVPLEWGSRCLAVSTGGVTDRTVNITGTIQIETIGAVTPGYPRTYGHYDLPNRFPNDQKAQEHMARLIRAIHEATGKRIPLQLSTLARWVPYPASYGVHARQRLNSSNFAAARGIVGHQHAPANCVTPDTPVLRGDLQWVPAGELETGDELVAFDEYPNTEDERNVGRRFRSATAIVHGIVEKDCYEVVFADGRTVTASADHKWLVNLPYVQDGSRIKWVETKDLVPGKHTAKTTGMPWEPRDDWEAGYLAGCIDCDGSVTRDKGHATFGFGQSAKYLGIMDRFLSIVSNWGMEVHRSDRGLRSGSYGPTHDFTDIRVRGGLWSTLGTLMSARSVKGELMADEGVWINASVAKTTRPLEITEVRHVGVREVVNLESSERTYLANGILCHNSHGDGVLGRAINDRAPDLESVVLLARGTTAPPVADVTAPAGSTWEVTATALNCRSGPGTQHEIIGAAAKGIKVTATGRSSGPWIEAQTPYQIDHKIRAWWHSGYLARVTAAPEPQPDPRARDAQERLAALGYDLGEHGVDGFWGPDSDIAARTYGADYGFTFSIPTPLPALITHLEETMTNIVDELRALNSKIDKGLADLASKVGAKPDRDQIGPLVWGHPLYGFSAHWHLRRGAITNPDHENFPVDPGSPAYYELRERAERMGGNVSVYLPGGVGEVPMVYNPETDRFERRALEDGPEDDTPAP